MVSLTQWTWIWASSRRWWRTRKHGMQQSMGWQRVGHDWTTTKCIYTHTTFGLSWWLRWLRICLQCRRPGFDPWVGETSWRREWATHSSILAWRIPWTEEPGRLQFMGSQSQTQLRDFLSPTSFIYIYIWVNHFAVHEKLTQQCKSIILQFKK